MNYKEYEKQAKNDLEKNKELLKLLFAQRIKDFEMQIEKIERRKKLHKHELFSNKCNFTSSLDELFILEEQIITCQNQKNILKKEYKEMFESDYEEEIKK